MAKERRDKRRRRISVLLKVVGIPLLILAILGTVLALTPFSSKTLDRQIQLAWRQATGLELSFRVSTYRLGKGILELTDVQIDNPAEGRRLTDIARMSIGWKWRPLTPSSLFALDSVRIVTPTSARLYLDKERRLVPDPRLESFLRLANRLRGRIPTQPTQVGLASFQIVDIQLYLYREDESGSRVVLGVKPLDIAFHSDPRGGWSLTLTGKLAGDKTTPLAKIRIDSDANSNEYFFTAILESFDLASHIHIPMPFQVETGEVTVKGVARVRQNRIELDRSSIQAKSVRLASVPDGTALSPVDAELGFHLEYEPSTHDLEIANVELKAQDSFVRGQGTARLGGRSDFAFQVAQAEVNAATLTWIQKAFPSVSKDLRVEKGSILVHGSMAGDAHGIDRSRCSGNLELRDVDVWTSWVGKSIGPLELEAKITTTTIDASKIDLQALEHRFRGSFRVGQPTDASTDTLDVRASWTAEIDAAGIKDLVPRERFAQVENWDLHGDVLGNGSIRGKWRFAAPKRQPASPENTGVRNPVRDFLERMTETLQIDGLLRLDDMRVDNPQLPAPIENLSGTLVMSNRTLECSNLEGEILGSTITLSGQIKDKKSVLLLTDPDFNMYVKGEIDLSQAPMVMEPSKRSWLRRFRPQGLMQVDLLARGPMLRPAELSLLGDVKASNVSLDLESPFARGELRNARLNIHLLSDRIELDEVRGQIASIDLSTSGTISQDRVDLYVSGTGDLSDGPRILPWLASPGWHVNGQARMSTHLDMSLRPETAILYQGDLFSNFLAVVNATEKSREVSSFDSIYDALEDRVDWKIDGVLDAQDCSLWQRTMPQKVTRINGRVLFDRSGFHTDGEGTAQWGQCAGITSLTMEVAPQGYPRFKFDARFPRLVIDEWVEGWGSNLMTSETLPRHAPFDPNAKPIEAETLRESVPLFVIETSIRSRSATYQKLDLDETSAHFVYSLYEKPVFAGLLELDRLDAQLYDGDIRMNLDLLWQHSSWWSIALTVKDIVCDELLMSLYERESTITGRLSGEAAIRGHSDDRANWSAEGTCALRNSRFLGNPIFAALGKILGHKGLEDISFTDMRGEFKVRNRVVQIPSLSFEGTLMDLYSTGQAGLDGSLDLMIFYKFFGALKNIPVLSQLTSVIDAVGKSILKVHAGGTIQNPQLTVVPFSADDFRIMGFKRVDETPPAKTPKPTPSPTASPETPSPTPLQGDAP